MAVRKYATELTPFKEIYRRNHIYFKAICQANESFFVEMYGSLLIIHINKKTSEELFGCFEIDVIPAGFEPTTHSLEGCCSIQLSYGTNRHEIFAYLIKRCKISIFF